MRHPASPAFLQHIASEYGSCPVEAAAHQIRNARRRRASEASPAGRLVECSNGVLSRKKKVSLVVIASTTSTVSASAPPFILATSSAMRKGHPFAPPA